MGRGAVESSEWKPSGEASDRHRSGYPLNNFSRTLQAPQDKTQTRLPRIDGGAGAKGQSSPNGLQSKSSPALRRGKGGPPAENEGALSPSHAAAASSGVPPGSSVDVTECLRMQYSAILQIAEAVRARPPPPPIGISPGEDGVTQQLHTEVTQLRETVARQQVELSKQQTYIAQLRATLGAAAPPPPGAAPPPGAPPAGGGAAAAAAVATPAAPAPAEFLRDLAAPPSEAAPAPRAPAAPAAAPAAVPATEAPGVAPAAAPAAETAAPAAAEAAGGEVAAPAAAPAAK